MQSGQRGKRGWLGLALAGALMAASPASAACKLGTIATLPVTMNGLRPMTVAEVNGTDAPFLVDSGAFYSMIPPSQAKRLNLKLIPVSGDYIITGVGGDVSINLAVIKAFTIAGQTIPKIPFFVGGSELGKDSSGLIGYNILGLADTEYDLAKGVIRLIRSEDCGREDFPYWGGPGQISSELALEPIPPKQEDHVFTSVRSTATASRIVTTISINGKPIRAQLDTGASTSVLSRAAATRLGIDVTAPDAKDIGFSAGIGKRRVRTWIVPVALVKIGGEEIRKTSLNVIDYLFQGADDPEMLLGVDFFLSHHIYVAKKLNSIYFTYNGGKVFTLRGAAAQ